MRVDEALAVANLNDPADRGMLADVLDEAGRADEAALLRLDVPVCQWDGVVHRQDDVWDTVAVIPSVYRDQEWVNVPSRLVCLLRDRILAALAGGRWRRWEMFRLSLYEAAEEVLGPLVLEDVAARTVVHAVRDAMAGQGLIERRSHPKGGGFQVRLTRRATALVKEGVAREGGGR